MQKRDIALYIFFSIITCGIFCLYWIAVINDDINMATSRDDTSGGMVVLFSIITCGIYQLYWFYKMGDRIDGIKMARGVNSNYTGLVYLLLGLFGFGIISVALMQHEINKLQ